MLIENRIRVHDRLKKENMNLEKSGFSVISKAGNKSIKISSDEINKAKVTVKKKMYEDIAIQARENSFKKDRRSDLKR